MDTSDWLALFFTLIMLAFVIAVILFERPRRKENRCRLLCEYCGLRITRGLEMFDQLPDCPRCYTPMLFDGETVTVITRIRKWINDWNEKSASKP